MVAGGRGDEPDGDLQEEGREGAAQPDEQVVPLEGVLVVGAQSAVPLASRGKHGPTTESDPDSQGADDGQHGTVEVERGRS